MESEINTTENFGKKFGYSRFLRKILIANNGIAAVKCIRSIRQWCYNVYENERIVHFVAMVTPEDLNGNAEYVQLADEFIPIPTGPSNLNYGNVDLIVEVAERLHVDAVWAGWGHASENPILPSRLAELKIIFMGPSSSSMWLLGDKISSILIAQTLNIPILPWSGSGVILKMDTNNTFHDIPPSIYQQCQVTSPTQISKLSSKIGFPFMLKASSGGGGKGIRKVNCNSECEKLFRQVTQEVPNSPIFISKILENARHIEVQLLGDYYGNVISIFTRDCSIQRRHQKIIEEAPATICPKEILMRMEEDAVKIAKSVCYYSVGTVEYLYDPCTNKYYFLELNPRLQVEHPCTEIIANINLLACQLQIAIGRTINEIEDIKYILNSHHNDNLEDSTKQDACYPKGHVIASRITAENPEEGFLPYSGSLRQLNFRSSRNIFGYFSVQAEGSLHKHADSQFGHLFSWGETRNDARKGLIMALKELSVHGEIRTTIDFLIGVLEHPSFILNNTNTCWLDNIKEDKSFFKKPSIRVIVACGAACIAWETFSKSIIDCEAAIERGQTPKYHSLVDPLEINFIYEQYKYSLLASMSSSHSLYITINSSALQVDVYNIGNKSFLISLDNRTFSCFFKEELIGYNLDIGSVSFLLYKDVNPSILRSPSSGKLVSYLVNDGSHVLKGTDYAEIEVMKMVMPLPSPESGIIHYIKPIGSMIESGTIIAQLDLDNTNKTTVGKPYLEALEYQTKSHQHSLSDNSGQSSQGSGCSINGEMSISRKSYISAHENLMNIMNGYSVHEPYFTQYLNDSLTSMSNYMMRPSFCANQLLEILSSLKNNLPIDLYESMSLLVSNYAANLTSVINQIPIDQITNLINNHAKTIQSISEREMFYATVHEMLGILNKLRKGIRYYKMSILMDFLKTYLKIEIFFPDTNTDYWISSLVYNNMSSDSTKISSDSMSPHETLRIIISHAKVQYKNILASRIIDYLCDYVKNSNVSSEDVKNLMTKLSNLPSNDHLKLALKAKQFLLSSFKPSFQVRHNQLESIFLSIIGSESSDSSIKSLTDIIHSDGVIFDIIPNFFFSSNYQIQTIALEVYIRRAYHCYNIVKIHHQQLNHIPIIRFSYSFPPAPASVVSDISAVESIEEVGVIDRSNYSLSINSGTTSNNNGYSSTNNKMIVRTTCGIMASFSSFEELGQHFAPFLSVLCSPIEPLNDMTSPVYNSYEDYSQAYHQNFESYNGSNVVTICVIMANIGKNLEDDLSDICQIFVNQYLDLLISYSIRRITFLLSSKEGEQPFYFTFRKRLDYKEDKLFRHIEPSIGFLLELKKMANFDLEYISCENPAIQIYYGVHNMMIDNKLVSDTRYFIRTIIRNVELISVEASFEYVVKASEIKLLEALDQLDVITVKSNKKGDFNHIFFNFTPCILIDPQRTIDCLKEIIIRHAGRLFKHKIMHAELKMEVLLEANGKSIPLRLIVSNVSGYSLKINLYKEVLDLKSGQYILDPFLGDTTANLSGFPSNTPYPVQSHLQLKRITANKQNIIYAYDYPQLFAQALAMLWKEYYKGTCEAQFSLKTEYAQFKELIFENSTSNRLVTTDRSIGSNDVGIICWECIFKIPNNDVLEAIVVINDATFINGSFTEAEAKVFKAAGSLAREKKIPFIYICCTSGARLGLANEVRDVFKVAWKAKNDYSKEIDYLYVDRTDYEKLASTHSIQAEKIAFNDEIRYKISDIYGKEDGIGVENLRGSGLIAGEMSKCFQETFTISLVTGKAVGIGAYLVRLGRRVIQVDGSSIILTGYEALNKVLGRDVYSSHTQLGGVDIMHNNGVSQLVAKNELDGIRLLLRWLSFSSDSIYKKRIINCPKIDDACLKIQIDEKLVTDPRVLLYGNKLSDKKTISGFFDPNSCFEINKGWAKSVITGRARIGGIPVAYIINEIHSVKSTIPADPADQNDVAKDVISIGQVLSPESSFKFSQTIEETNAEKLPLFIFANLRGFSAGLKDMYNQVLKYGAMIVDNLRVYSHPVFIYILPKGEVRGGAWAVLDTSINPEHIEIYSCEDSRANVLEPAGVVSVKFRTVEIDRMIKRLDPSYDLNAHINQSLDETILINETVRKAYLEVAIKFADLHDTPNRMVHKKVISGILKWGNSREFFYWRLKRRLYESKVFKIINDVDPRISLAESNKILEEAFAKSAATNSDYLDDKFVVNWFENSILIESTDSVITKMISQLTSKYFLHQIQQGINKNPDLKKEIISNIYSNMSAQDRDDVLNSLNIINRKISSHLKD